MKYCFAISRGRQTLNNNTDSYWYKIQNCLKHWDLENCNLFIHKKNISKVFMSSLRSVEICFWKFIFYLVKTEFGKVDIKLKLKADNYEPSYN